MPLQIKFTVALVNVWWCRCCRREEDTNRLAVLCVRGEGTSPASVNVFQVSKITFVSLFKEVVTISRIHFIV
jgi:hypothetical protein